MRSEGQRGRDRESENKANTDTCLHLQAYIEHEHVMLSHIAASVQIHAPSLSLYLSIYFVIHV